MTSASKIKHLYWRAGFGLSPKEWATKQNWSLNKAIEQLFTQAQDSKAITTPDFLGSRSNEQLKKLGKGELRKLKKIGQENVRDLNVAWIERMSQSKESPLLERICLFWHGHFACELKNPILAARQMNTLRQHGLGRFRDLLQAMAKDVAMIRYLNNQQNKKRKPNENFAREVMELFSIGRGHYSEKDVKEAARAFTGWSSDLRGDFVFRKQQHDFESKTFMGQKGTFNGDEIIDILLEQEATASFICRKIYSYFVNEKIDENRVRELSRDFYESDYDIGKLLRQIFYSDWFYAPQNVGTKIKSPIDLVAGIMGSLEVKFTTQKSLLFAQRALGQILFKPPNVAGWPGGKSWIDNSTLLLRLNLVAYLYRAAEVAFNDKDLEAKNPGRKMQKLEAQTNFNPLIALFDQQEEAAIFMGLKNYFLQANSKLTQTQVDAFAVKGNKEDYIKSVALQIMSLPEYQMC